MIVSNHWWISLYQILLHVCVTALAIGIAFSLPVGASYILYQWWPIVAEDANLLMASEVVLAGMLVLLFNMAGIAWANRSKVRMTDLASLVHVRQSDSWLARWRERRLVKPLPAVRDGFVLTITGFDTFADEKSLLGEALNNAYEMRVMLLNPHGEGAGKRVDSLPEQITRQNFISEVESSIAHLTMLRTLGKKVSLKFYEHEPFWKIVVLGDHVWVQHCHSGCEVKREPEYVFALNRKHPRQGFFIPFYMHFLEQWSDHRHPEYDFDTSQLIYRDADGKEIKRVVFDGNGGQASAVSSSSRGGGASFPPAAHRDATQQAPAVHY